MRVDRWALVGKRGGALGGGGMPKGSLLEELGIPELPLVMSVSVCSVSSCSEAYSQQGNTLWPEGGLFKLKTVRAWP